MSNQSIPGPTPGRYRHYKGNEYTVVGIARHSETQEELVVYRPEYGDRALWVRPKEMFLETVPINGQDVPRFRPLALETPANPSSPGNLLHNLPTHLPAEIIETLLTAPNLRIERIVSQGHTSPADFWYDQPQQEWVLLLTGHARLQFAANLLDLHPGDYVHIPAQQRHRVAWTTPSEPTIWLAIHFGDAIP